MKYDDKHNNPGPALIITLGGEPETRKKVAKGKVGALKKKLAAIHAAWKPSTPEGKDYNKQIAALLDDKD